MERGQKIAYGIVVVLVIAFLLTGLAAGFGEAGRAAGLVATAFFAVLLVLVVVIVLGGLLGKNVPEWLEKKGKRKSE